MKIFSKLSDHFENDVSMRTLVKVILILLVIFLLKQTDMVWKGILNTLVTIFTPFFFGFAIAYVLRPLIRWGETKNIKQGIMVAIIYLVALVLVFWLLFTLIPLIISRLSSFISSIISGVNWLYAYAANASANGVPEWIQSLVNSIIEMLNDTKTIIPNITKSLPSVFSYILSGITAGIFTIIISIYMSAGWDRFRKHFFGFFYHINPELVDYVNVANEQLGSYVRSLLILMIIKFIEYALLYFFIGHPDWLILGLLTSIGLIVPYLGPTVANVIALLTALTLPTGKIIAVLVVILVMSNVDEYVIAPKVHSRNTKITPLWALFSIFAGGIIGGPLGIMVAIPCFLAIRAIYREYREKHPKQTPENGTDSVI